MTAGVTVMPVLLQMVAVMMVLSWVWPEYSDTVPWTRTTSPTATFTPKLLS